MSDLYSELFTLLQKKEQAIPAQVNSVKVQIKGVADQLREHPTADYHLDAAFAYYVAGYYVRAARLVAEADLSLESHAPQRWLALILVKHFDEIKDQVHTVAADDRYSDRMLQQEILHHGLSDFEALDRIFVSKLADVLHQFVQFIHSGDEKRLGIVHSGLSLCQKSAAKACEWRWWWWLECIRYVVNEFTENCLWTQLKSMREEYGADELVSKYILANYRRSNPVVELWRTQVESLDKDNDLERNSFCLAVAPGAGKTRVAELAILRFFLDYRDDPDAKCIYIAPFRTLASEVEETLEPVFSEITSNRSAVSRFYGGHEVDILDLEELGSARVLIATPEKLDGMLRHYPRLVSQIRLVIADEGHLIGEGHTPGDTGSYRGYRYRMLLERLVYALRVKHDSTATQSPRFLFISGVLPHVEELAELITGDRKNVVSIEWNPRDELLKGRWIWNGEKLVTTQENLEPPIFSLSKEQSEPQFEEVVVRAALACALGGSRTMVFSASKRAINSATLLDLLKRQVELSPLPIYPLPSELPRLGGIQPYDRLLERGVAIHHAGLPPDLKKETEARISTGRVHLLFTSTTLAHGVNIPFDTVLVYRLQHYPGARIHDATFWNVVGRVGRPITGSSNYFTKLHPPRVVFLLNISSRAWEDKQDINISRELLNSEKRYRVATPFLNFLNELRREWMQSTGRPVAELVNNLAERRDLEWIEHRGRRGELQSLLSLLDEHLTALIEESCLDLEQAADWLQDSSKQLIDLLVQATTIKPDDLEFIKQAALARARFIAKNIPKPQRRQDYLLGLPFADCETIRANQEDLLSWYQGCADIFARKFDSGVDSLAQILNFVSSLSICKKKWRSKQTRLPMFGLAVPDKSAIRRSALFRNWILGKDAQTVTSKLREVHPNADLDEYCEEMFETSLSWGVSAISRFLNDLAQEQGLSLTKDLEYLPSLVKYGVPGKLACYLVRLNIPREDAIRITESYIGRTTTPDPWELISVLTMPLQAEDAIKSLTESELASLNLSETGIQRVHEIKRAH
jgi:superfamily II DNA/RNA helicase